MRNKFTNKLLPFGCALFTSLFSNQLLAFSANLNTEQTIILNNPTPNDSLLVLAVEMQDGLRILRVSFNGNEGNDGTLQIKHNSTTVKMAHFELIKQPYYASVDITSLNPGTYQVILTSATGTHLSTLIID